MSCHKIQDLFADFLTGEADEAARREVQDHIASCAACRADLEELTAAWARLGLLPAEAPSGRLRAGFYAMLDAAKEEEERRTARPRAGRLFAAWWEGVWAGRPALAMGLAGALFPLGNSGDSLLISYLGLKSCPRNRRLISSRPATVNRVAGCGSRVQNHTPLAQ